MRDRFIFASKKACELEINAKSKDDLMEASLAWLEASIAAQQTGMIKNMKHCKKRSEYCESYTTVLALEARARHGEI